MNDSGLKCGKVTGSSVYVVGRIGGRISVMTEWLGKQILDGFLRQFQTKAGGTSKKVQRKTAKEMVSDCIKITCTVDL